MYDDNAGNVYCKYLEDIIKRQDEIIDDLKEGADYQTELIDQLEMDKRILLDRVRLKNVIQSKLAKQVEELEATIFACQIQAAESEFRADEEKRARLMLKMRL